MTPGSRWACPRAAPGGVQPQDSTVAGQKVQGTIEPGANVVASGPLRRWFTLSRPSVAVDTRRCVRPPDPPNRASAHARTPRPDRQSAGAGAVDRSLARRRATSRARAADGARRRCGRRNRRRDACRSRRGASSCWPGPGNNGGDAFVCARHLRARGFDVDVVSTGDATRLPPDAAAAWSALQPTGARFLHAPPAEPPGLIVDGLFGVGLTRALAPPYADVGRVGERRPARRSWRSTFPRASMPAPVLRTNRSSRQPRRRRSSPSSRVF